MRLAALAVITWVLVVEDYPIFVRAGANPGDRSEWLFRPALGRASVRPAAAGGAGRGIFAGALGLVTVATFALVVVRRPSSRSGRPSASACP